MDNNLWFIGTRKDYDLDIKYWICKKNIYSSDTYIFILPYSNFLYYDSYYKTKNTWSTSNEFNFKKLEQIKFTSVKNASIKLKNIINVEIFSNEKIDYLDIGSQNDKISFLPVDKINLLNNEDPYNNRYRKEIKIGKCFYKYSIFNMKSIPLKSIEILTNVYKSINNYSDKIEIVNGEDIRYWYNGENYAHGQGDQLNKSCMKHKNYYNRFDLYVKNPEVCKMLIIKNDFNKLIARALLWKTDLGMFMDRIYSINDYHFYTFLGYAKKNNYLTRDNDINKKMLIKLNKIDLNYNNMPYLDTFKYYDYENYILSNKRLFGENYTILNNY